MKPIVISLYFKKSFLEETWLNIAYRRVPSPRDVWIRVEQKVLSECCGVSVATRLTKSRTHLLQSGAVSACKQEAGLEQTYPVTARVSLVTGLTVPSCAHPAYCSTPGLEPRMAAIPEQQCDQAGRVGIVLGPPQAQLEAAAVFITLF